MIQWYNVQVHKSHLYEVKLQSPNALFAVVLCQKKCLQRMSKASSVVASVTQQSR